MNRRVTGLPPKILDLEGDYEQSYAEPAAMVDPAPIATEMTLAPEPFDRPQRPVRFVSPRRKAPVLEILVAVLLVGGAFTALWILRSTLPGRRVAPVSLAVSPEEARVVAGKTAEFATVVSGTTDTEVTWTLQEGEAAGIIVSRGAKAEGGQVAAVAVYTAPVKAGTYHLVATSKADPNVSATATIKVVRK